MKLDYDLIRELLLHIEEISNGEDVFTRLDLCQDFLDTNSLKLVYHLKYLDDAGLIECHEGYITDITPLGRSYLDNIRNPGIWQEILRRAHPFGSVALSVLSDIGSSLIKSKLGI